MKKPEFEIRKDLRWVVLREKKNGGTEDQCPAMESVIRDSSVFCCDEMPLLVLQNPCVSPLGENSQAA